MTKVTGSGAVSSSAGASTAGSSTTGASAAGLQAPKSKLAVSSRAKRIPNERFSQNIQYY